MNFIADTPEDVNGWVEGTEIVATQLQMFFEGS